MREEPQWEGGVGFVAGVQADAWLEKLRSSGRDIGRDVPAERAIAGFMTARDAYAEAG